MSLDADVNDFSIVGTCRSLGVAFSVCHTLEAGTEGWQAHFLPAWTSTVSHGVAELCVTDKGQSPCWELMTGLHTTETFESN